MRQSREKVRQSRVITSLATTLRQPRLGAVIDESVFAQAREGENATYLTRWVAEDEASPLTCHQLVTLDDCCDPDGIDEVALVEVYEDIDILCGGGIEPPFKLIGDGEVQLTLHSQLATSGVVILDDPKCAHLLSPQWLSPEREAKKRPAPLGASFVNHNWDFDALT